MSDSYSLEYDRTAVRHRDTAQGQAHTQDTSQAFSPSLLQGRGTHSSANSSVRAQAMHGMQQRHGNRAVQRTASASTPVIQRWPDLGSVWDSVSNADWRNSGGGQPFDPRIQPGEIGVPVEAPIRDTPPAAPAPWKTTTVGNEPKDDDGTAFGSYAYGKKTTDGSGETRGYEGGFGGVHWGGLLGIDIGNGEGKIGDWEEGRQSGDPDRRGGFRVGGGILKGSINQGGLVSGDVGIGTASAEANIGTNGAAFGAQANVAEASMTAGKFSNASNVDESSRFGLSVGGGMAGRLHWGDSDNDGHREIGAGFDFGIFSADMKTEDPLRTALNSGPGGGFSRTLTDMNDLLGINDKLGYQLLPSKKHNMTEDMLGVVSGSGKPTTIDNAIDDAWKKLAAW